MRTRGLLLSFALLALAAAVAPRALAQQAQEPQEGDLLWTFAEEDPFYDQRVRLALILLMDLDGTVLLPASAEDREFIAMPGISADAPLLLAAAGIDFAVIDVIGSCGVWVAPPPVGGSPIGVEEREQAALALGSAFSAVLESHGTAVGECALTADPSAAQILVWGFGETAPANPLRPAGTLLAQASLPGAQPGEGTGGGAPAPPAGGSGGLTGGAHETAAVDVLLLLALTVALPLAARSLTSQSPR